MKALVAIWVMIALPLAGMAQHDLSYERTPDYTTAVGLRAGESSGITFKYIRTDQTGLELILSAWPNDLVVYALYEKHYKISDVDGLRWFFGAGGHVSLNTWSRTYYVDKYGRFWWYKNRTGVGIGIDGIAGLDYKIPPLPLSISLDLKPYMEINSDGHVYLSPDPGLSLRLAF